MEPSAGLGEEARRSLPDCSRVVLFDDRGGLLYSSCTVNTACDSRAQGGSRLCLAGFCATEARWE